MRMMAMTSLLMASPGAHDQRAQLLKVLRLVTPRDDDDVIEAELAQPVQALAGRLPRALEVGRVVGAVGGLGLAQMLDHVGDDGAPAAKVAKPLDPLAQEPPVAPGTRSHPAVQPAGRPLDPARARPRAGRAGGPAARPRPTPAPGRRSLLARRPRAAASSTATRPCAGSARQNR